MDFFVFSFQGIEVHASRDPQAFGKHADALGANPRRQRFVSHNWRDHVCQRDSVGY
jgi:hypothetical protein